MLPKCGGRQRYWGPPRTAAAVTNLGLEMNRHCRQHRAKGDCNDRTHDEDDEGGLKVDLVGKVAHVGDRRSKLLRWYERDAAMGSASPLPVDAKGGQREMKGPTSFPAGPSPSTRL